MMLLRSFVFFIFMCNAGLIFAFDLSQKNEITLSSDKIYAEHGGGFYLFNNNLLYYLSDNIFDELLEHNTQFDNMIINDTYIVIYSIDNISVFEKKDMQLLWRKKINGRITSNIVIAANTLVLNKNFSTIIAFDMTTGRVSWKFKLEMDPLVFVTNSKLVQTEDYLVYIYADQKIYLFSKVSGQPIKSSTIKNEHVFGNIDYKSEILSVKLYNGTVYVLYTDGHFLAYNLPRQDLMFIKDKCNYKNFDIFDDTLIFIDTYGIICAFDKDMTHLIWKNNFLGDSNMVLIHDKELIMNYNSEGLMYFIEPYSGSLIYKQNFMSKIKDVMYSDDNLLILFGDNSNVLFNVLP